MSKWIAYNGKKVSHYFYPYADGLISSCRVYIVPSIVDKLDEEDDKPHCKRCEAIEANGGPVWERER